MRPMPLFRHPVTAGPRSSRRARIALTVAFALLPGLLISPLTAVAQGAKPLGRPDAPKPVSVKTVPLKPKQTAVSRLIARQAAAERKAAVRALHDQDTTATWPAPGTATLTTPATGMARGKAGSLPLSLSAPTAKASRAKKPAQSVKVSVLSRKQTKALGIKGVALTVTAPPTGGTADLTVDYSSFAHAYGADWAGRLQVLRLPDCAATQPGKASCRSATPVTFTNDRRGQKLDTHLTFGTTRSASAATGQTMLLALAAGTKSGGGDYKATPLSASSTWQAGGSSGTFTWRYPLKMPPAAAGPSPDLSISYDSGSVDGRTASTNNQGSQIGEGFDLTSSYVERKYGSCDDDGQDGKYDLCWKYDNASLVLNGKATELVKDDTDGTWRLKDDDASFVTHSTGADNGDDGDDIAGGKGDGKGEYWTVITGDGTKYVFGLNKLDGAGSERTNSVWTVPVFGDDDGEPGYSSGTSLSGRSKTQAWRWNLDYVEDTHGNAMSYWYTAETNNYDTLGDDSTGTGYTRGGYLSKILYGQQAGTLFSATPAASGKVTFDYDERCIRTDNGCDSLTESTSTHWPDVPYDAICNDGDKCTGNVGPSFFTRKRLTAIHTYAWNAALSPSADFQPVDSWKLTQQYVDPGEISDGTDQSLWLQAVQHTGEHGTPLSTDPLTLTYEFMTNRVDGASDNILPLAKPRLTGITTETGAKTAVTYAPAECVAGQTRPRPDQNTSTCYPVYWRPNGGNVDPILDWFQKYPVTAVNTTDETGASGTITDTYQYDGAAWHYNDDPLTPEKERTWSTWRGFEKVTHFTGPSDGTRSKTATIYMQGMNGDRLLEADGKTLDPDTRRSAPTTGIKAPAISDADQYAGFTRETVTYNGADEVTGTVNDPWSHRTATQHKSYADTEAYYVRTGATHTRTNITSGSQPLDRTRTTATTFDDYGMPQTVEDQGDDAVSGDETCTRTWYARNPAAGLTALVSRVRVTAKPCATADSALNLPADSTAAGDVISDTATTYDATSAWSALQLPTKGEAQWTGRASGYDSSDQPSWQKLTTTTFDTLGRPTLVKDTNDAQVSKTTYTPAAAGPLTATTVYDAKNYNTNTLIDFATGATTKVTDPNSKVTESTYDSLGRVTQVWLPNRLHLLNATPNYTYAYHLSNNSVSWVSTSTLTPTASGYTTSYTLYDSLLRARETQSPSPSGGRIVNLTQYDTRGLVSSILSDIWDANNAPSGNPATVEGGQAPLQVDTTYDGAARPLTSETKVKGAHRWTTTTTYQGDRAIQTAPAGGQAVSNLTNALGQTTETRQYATPDATGSYNRTRYTYTPGGQQKTITAQDNSAWSYTYDLFGRQTSAADPDKGTTTTHYNTLDQVDWTQDAENRKLLYQYDILGRKTDLWQTDNTAANKLAHWDYDQVAKGQQDTATSYVGGSGTGGQAYVKKVTKFDNFYNATISSLTLPAGDAFLAAGVGPTLTFNATYNAANQLSNIGDPAVAGLASEGITNTFDNLGNLKTVNGTTGYLLGAAYSELGDLTTLTLGTDSTTSAKKAYLNYAYEEGTRRLTRSYVTDDTHGYMPQDLHFTQDDAGNVTSVSDASTLGGTAQADNQCFAYDGYSRLTEAWTPKTADCSSTGRTKANLGGAAPYWTSYSYTTSGQRNTETQHLTSGDQTTTHVYGTAKGQPHPLDHTTGAKNATYTYDLTGNTTHRPGATATQTLNWNSEDKLSSLIEGTKQTNYIYDADGNLLIRRATGDGDSILYLGDTEVRLTVKGTTKTLSGTRYYTASGKTIAVRTSTAGTSTTKLAFLAADPHGTASLTLDATTWAVNKRYTSPFGADRGQPLYGPWPDDKGFLGKPADTTTGLTHIGAREYDPGIGQFLSVDPLLTVAEAQSLNGYTYADNNPVTSADPTGTCADIDCPTRPGPGFENTTPGHVPGKPKKSQNTQLAESGETWDSGTAQSGDSGSTGGSTGCHYVMGNTYCDAPVNTGPVDTTVNEGTPIPDWHEVVGIPVLSCDDGWKCDVRQSELDLSVSTGMIGGSAGGISPFRPKFVVIPELEEASVASKRGVGLGGCLNSFDAQTQVLTANGTPKPIKEVKPGDKVAAADPTDGHFKGARTVEARLVHRDSDRLDLAVRSSSGKTAVIHTTDHHAFWDDTRHAWVIAASLSPGHVLSTPTGGHATVVRESKTDGTADMYNLTVDDLHTYYVLAGATPVLVHNSGAWCGPGFRTASEAGIRPNDARRIQNAADKTGQTIIVVGSRAGTEKLNPTSDWDYILTGPSRARSSVKNSLPQGMGDGEGGSGRGRDFYQSYNPNAKHYTELDRKRPYVVFEPRG
jgi:RHS repeat-associated protein